MFTICAEVVDSRKKNSPGLDTTRMLNELLADDQWLETVIIIFFFFFEGGGLKLVKVRLFRWVESQNGSYSGNHLRIGKALFM